MEFNDKNIECDLDIGTFALSIAGFLLILGIMCGAYYLLSSIGGGI